MNNILINSTSLPLVSVVLPVYNVAHYITETISSLLSQTLSDFELLILDDCSTDETASKVKSIRDPRLRFIQNPRNIGRAGTDNAAVRYVRGEFVAKMDGDDLCYPERLARQVAFLRQYPEVNVVGGWMQNFGASTYLNRYPATPDAARVRTLFTLPIGNPSVMLRASLFREHGMHYDMHLRQTEDYDFFARYVRDLQIATLPEALIHYRVPPDASKKQILTERASVSDQVRARLLMAWGIPVTPREQHVHNTISMLERPFGDITLSEAEVWLQKLLRYNKEMSWFEPVALRHGLAERLFEICYTHPQSRLLGARQFRRSSLASYFSPTSRQQLQFWTKAVLNF